MNTLFIILEIIFVILVIDYFRFRNTKNWSKYNIVRYSDDRTLPHAFTLLTLIILNIAIIVSLIYCTLP